MMKAVSSIELGMDTLTHKPFEELTDDEIVAHMHVQDAERVFLSLIHISLWSRMTSYSISFQPAMHFSTRI